MNFWRHPRTLLLLALCAAAGLAVLASAVPGLIYKIDIVEKGGILVILGVSLNLILGHTGQFSLGHAGFMAVGAFAAAAATNLMGPHDSIWVQQALMLPALLAGGLMAAFVGLLVGIPSLRLRGDYLAIVTLGFGEILFNLLKNAQNAIYQSEYWSGKLPWVGAAAVKVPAPPTLFWTLALCAITLYVCQSLVKSTFGTGLLAVRDNEVAAEACGISAARAKVIAFVVGAFFAGIAGGLFAHSVHSVSPDQFRFDRSFIVVLVVILGGTGRNFAVMGAAIAVTALSESLRFTKDIPGVAGHPQLLEILQNRELFFALILVILMILRPQGVFNGWKKPKFLSAFPRRAQ